MFEQTNRLFEAILFDFSLGTEVVKASLLYQVYSVSFG